MERFLVTIIIISILAWGSGGYLVLFTAPYSEPVVLLFLFNILIGLEFSLALLIYMLRQRSRPQWYKSRDTFRESAKLALPPALSATLFLFLRYFGMASPLNLGVLLLLLGLAEVQVIREV